MQKKTIYLLSLWIISIAFFLALVFAGNPPSVNLLNPGNGAVFNTTNNITFSCNATDDGTLRKIDLYSTINGAFSKTNTSCFGELCEDTSTKLIMHFNNDSSVGENNTYVYDWSGNGNNATVTGAAFNATGGKFFGAFKFDGTANKYMKISDSNSIRLATAGSIEFWVKPSTPSGGYLFLKGPPDATCTQSSYDVKIFASNIYLDLNGDNNILLTSGDQYQSNGTVAPGIWYQIVYTWNGSWVDIYMNGARDSPSQPQAHPISSNTYNLWIGATNDSTCSYYPYFSGTIDELAIYSRQLTLQEVSEHYNRTLINNATKNWTVKNVSDGTYQWNCRAENNQSQSSWAASNRTLYVDLHTPPQVSSITLSPNSTDDVDPGVTLRVTANITDASGVSAAILQYTSPSPSNFTSNVTMAYDSITKQYNASFTPGAEGVWKYKIWANDTLGNSNTTGDITLPVYYDSTWKMSAINISGSVSSDFGTISALNGTTKGIGTAVINNTGDYNLTLGFSSSPEIMSYNVTPPISLAAKNAVQVAVNVTVPQAIMEWPIQLIVNASYSGNPATPPGNFIAGTLVPFKGGPYLDVSIQNYQATVSHNQEINLSARIKNIGNETATEVYVNWTLPGGWGVTAGNKSDYLGNITNNTVKWSNITVKISTALASVGTFENGISVTAKSGENATGTDSKTVSVVCRNADGVCGNGCSYATDTDCPVPAATGGPTGTSTPAATGGGKAPAKYYSIVLGSQDKIDANRGSPVRFKINITNPNRDTRIENITYSLVGYSQVLTLGEPKTISAISYGEIKTIMFRLEVPNYTRYGEYPLEVTAYGQGTSSGAENSTDVSASRKITLVVRSATENETRSIIGEASKSIESLAALNIAAPKILQMLEDAMASLTEWDYDAAKELAVKALEAGRSAAKSYGSLRQVESAISEADKYGVDARETKKMYSLAEAAFERGDYARAEERANNAMLAAAIEASAKVSILRFLHTYYLEIILASAMLAAALFFIYRKIAAETIKRKIARLGKEEEVIRKLIADAKKEYFEKRSITKADYKRAVYEYENRLNEIKKARSQMILRLAGLARPEKVIEGFKKEEKRLLGLIEAAQKDYFERGKISKTHYHGTMQELNAELAQVRLAIVLAGRKAGKNKPLALALLPAALLLMLLGAAAHAAADAAGASGAISQAEADIIEMQKAGLSIALANDTLNEARLLYAKGNYAGAESLAKYVGAIKKTAISTYALVDDAEGKIFEAEKEGLDVADAKNDFDAGLSALENSDYPGAEELLNSAISKADKARADAAMEGALGRTWMSDAKGFALQKKKQIAVLLVSMAAVFAAAKKKYKSMKRANRIRHLEDEEKAASKMIRELQKNYFLDGKLSRAEYASRVKRYGEIILRAKKDISVLRSAEKKGKA